MYKSGLTQLIRWKLRTGIPRRAGDLNLALALQPMQSSAFSLKSLPQGSSTGLHKIALAVEPEGHVEICVNSGAGFIGRPELPMTKGLLVLDGSEFDTGLFPTWRST
jgi:hypothetical protein